MSTQLAQVELAPAVVPKVTAPPLARSEIRDCDLLDSGNPTGIIRGIVSALLIATPFWILFGFALYFLI